MTAHRYDGPLRRELRDPGPRKRAYATVRAGVGMPIADRIKLHVALDADSGCWVWQLALVPRTGYGCLSVDGKLLRAHRASYEAFVGPIPDGMQIDHLCRNRACVNPQHLEPVTAQVNNWRSPLTHGKETHCPYGHAYDDANTYRDPRGMRRQCKTCRNVYRRLRGAMTPEEREARKSAGLLVVDLEAYFAGQRQERAA